MKINEIILLQKLPPSKKEKQTMHSSTSPLVGGSPSATSDLLQECYRGYIKRQDDKQVKCKLKVAGGHGYGFRHDSRKNLRK